MRVPMGNGQSHRIMDMPFHIGLVFWKRDPSTLEIPQEVRRRRSKSQSLLQGGRDHVLQVPSS